MSMISLSRKEYLVGKLSRKPGSFEELPSEAIPLFDLYGLPVPNMSFVRFGHFNAYLYAAFRCFFREMPEDVSGLYGNRVFRGECVELFLGGKKEYLELDVSPFGNRFYALIRQEGEEHSAEELPLPVTTTEKWYNGCYEVVYRIPKEELSRFDELCFNAFRVEGVYHKERFSRAAFATNRPEHHVPESFGKLILE